MVPSPLDAQSGRWKSLVYPVTPTLPTVSTGQGRDAAHSPSRRFR